MGSKIHAFRPAVVVDRLAPRNDACPLSLRDLLQAADAARCVLPIVRAPIGGVAREHRFIRADRFSDEEGAADHAIMKGQQIVDQLGEHIFE